MQGPMNVKFLYLLQNAPVLEISDAGHFACHSQIPNLTDSVVYLRPFFYKSEKSAGFAGALYACTTVTEHPEQRSGG
jgi:hypothetical protein